MRARSASRSSRGPVGSLLYGLAAVAIVLMKSEWFRRWLTSKLGVGAAWVLMCAVTLLLLASAALIAQRHQRKLQVVRDHDIAIAGPVALYLRPFFIDKHVFANPYYTSSPDNPALLSSELIGRVLEPYIRVRQLGGGPETLANTRVPVPLLDDAWKLIVKQQILTASVAIILPLMDRDRKTGEIRGQATLWELGYLIESGAIARTIVMMPSAAWVSRRRVGNAWEHGRTAARDLGLFLPPYTKDGDVMTFARDDGGRWRVAGSFGRAARGHKRIAVGLVEAVQWLAHRHGFALLDR